MTESIDQKAAQLMELADTFCNASDNVTRAHADMEMLGAHAGMDENNRYWVAMKRARDALEAAIRTELQESFAAGMSCRPASVQPAAQAELASENELLVDALESIAWAGMSPPSEMSQNSVEAWHARQAWKFIGIAARALPKHNQFSQAKK
jgi:hypothetical protein